MPCRYNALAPALVLEGARVGMVVHVMGATLGAAVATGLFALVERIQEVSGAAWGRLGGQPVAARAPGWSGGGTEGWPWEGWRGVAGL